MPPRWSLAVRVSARRARVMLGYFVVGRTAHLLIATEVRSDAHPHATSASASVLTTTTLLSPFHHPAHPALPAWLVKTRLVRQYPARPCRRRRCTVATASGRCSPPPGSRCGRPRLVERVRPCPRCASNPGAGACQTDPTGASDRRGVAARGGAPARDEGAHHQRALLLLRNSGHYEVRGHAHRRRPAVRTQTDVAPHAPVQAVPIGTHGARQRICVQRVPSHSVRRGRPGPLLPALVKRCGSAPASAMEPVRECHAWLSRHSPAPSFSGATTSR